MGGGHGRWPAWSMLATVMVMVSCASSAERASAARLAIEDDALVYTADKGESNAVRISGAASTFVVRDSGATIRAVTPCTVSEPRQNVPAQASCPAQGLANFAVDAGDGDDVVIIDNLALPAAVVGGPGDDRIEGGDGGDLLVGLSGNDLLTGRSGPDNLRGGPGDDILAGGAGDDSFQTDSGADSLDGGPGFDSVSYADRFVPVAVTLDGVANDGQQGEGDNVLPTSEGITGGGANDFISGRQPTASSTLGLMLAGESGDDVLTGGPLDDAIRGGRGNDRISGGPGPDVLLGGVGSDVIAGDEGDDLVEATDTTIDLIDCGDGSDSASLDSLDGRPPSCEEDVPGGTPGGVSASSVPGFYEFSGETLSMRRGRGGVIAFRTDKRGDNRSRRPLMWLRFTFFTANGRRVGPRPSCEVRVDTRRSTRIRLRRVPRKARKVAIEVDTNRFRRSPGLGRSPCTSAR
jgi:Ca2+-binding RTX toxin-like protein